MWGKRLTRFFGTSDWVSAFYRKNTHGDLFDGHSEAIEKTATISAISDFFNLRLRTVFPYVNGFSLTLQEDLVDIPRRWKQPRVVFVNSMSDLFQEGIPVEFIARVFRTMEECPQHTFQILTKRSGRLRRIASKLPWPENVWMGVSVEDTRVIHRVEDLASVPARVRFLSCEPLIGPLEALPLKGIHWAIVGGESGPHARPMRKEWVQSILGQCRRAGTAFFFKQWGGVRKDLTGRKLNGRTYDEMPLVQPLRRAA